MTLPRQSQLTQTNVTLRVIVPGGTKFDVLGFIFVSESRFRRLVKAANDVVQVIDEVGFFKES